MKKKEWVINKLNECNNSCKLASSKENYQEYIRDTDSDAAYLSFKRYVYSVHESISDDIDEEVVIPTDYDFLPLIDDEEILIEFLESYIKLKNRKLKVSDLEEIARRNNFSVRSFENIKDIDYVLSNLYKVNSLSFKDELDSLRLRKKIDFLEREIKALKENQVDYSTVIESLEDIIEIYEPWKIKNIISSSKEKERVIVGLFSDIHAGELVSLTETHGLNEYNVNIMKERIDSFFIQLIEYAEEVGSSKLYFKMLGDMVNGEIHEELVRNSDLDTMESIILCADYISQWLRRLSEYFDEITLIGLSGNHGRFSKKPSFKKKNKLNFDYFVYEFIKRETKEIVKEFILPDSPFYIHSILGYRFFSAHGDIFKGGTGLSPISGTWGRDIEKLNGIYRQHGGDFDYAEFAHFHNSILDIPSFSGISIMVNGSIKGADEFSINAVKAGSIPSQIVYVVEKGVGVKFRSTINLN
jgi:hypothetical protein